MGMHRLFNDDYSGRVGTPTQAELNDRNIARIILLNLAEYLEEREAAYTKAGNWDAKYAISETQEWIIRKLTNKE